MNYSMLLYYITILLCITTINATTSSSVITLPSKSDIISTLLNNYSHSNLPLYDHTFDERNLSEFQQQQQQKDQRVKLSTLNQIFSKITLSIPNPPTVSKSGLELTITNLKCTNLNINELTLLHNSIPNNPTKQVVNIDIKGINLRCDFNWEYKFTLFNGRGVGNAILNPTSTTASIGMSFLSDDYNVSPPNDVNVHSCDLALDIQDMDFDGDGIGIVGGIIALFEGLLRDTVENELEKTVCTELKKLGDDNDTNSVDGGKEESTLDGLLTMVNGYLDEYLIPSSESESDALSYENSIDLPMISASSATDNDNEVEEEKSLYVNFQQLDQYANGWITTLLDQVDSFLQGPDSSNSDVVSTSSTLPFNQLNINQFIRDNLLNSDNKLLIDPSIFFDDGNLFSSHDILSHSTLKMKSISIEGLDSFTQMDILNPIGKHTLQNKLALDYLYIEVEMEASIKPSSQSNAIIVSPNSQPIIESFTVDFSITQLELDISIFLGMNIQSIGELELGSLLFTKNILPCLLSIMDDIQITNFNVSVNDIIPPKLSGFIDTGLDTLMTQAADALFSMYENVIKIVLTNFFNGYVKELVNDFVDDALDLYSCPTMNEYDDRQEEETYIDFRDLVNTPTTALSIGGVGDERYGDIIPKIMKILNDQVFSAMNENGLSKINDWLISPWTKEQSGIEGSINFDTLLDLNKERVELDIWKSFADYLRLSISNFSISGLDTVRGPLKILEPSSTSGYLLENGLSLGSDVDMDKQFNASFQLGIEVGDDTSPLATNNVMDLSLTMPSMDIVAILFATINEGRLMKYPLNRYPVKWF